MARRFHNKWRTPCPYCGKLMRGMKGRQPTQDHVYPKSRGGTLNNDNCRIVCKTCNQDKGQRTPREFLEALRETNDPRAEHVECFVASYDLIMAFHSAPNHTHSPTPA